MSKKYLRYDDTELDEVSLKKVRQEIREEDGAMEKCQLQLKEKLMSTKNLRPNLDENFLAYMLRLSKFDVDKAYSRILAMYELKKKYDFLYDHELPSQIPRAQAAKILYALKYRAPDNSVIVVRKIDNYDPDDGLFFECVLLVSLCCHFLYKNPITQMCGMTVLVDLEGTTLSHLLHLTRFNKIPHWSNFQKIGPCRIPAIHFVNTPKIFALFRKGFLSVMPSKVRKRVHFHPNDDNWKSLHSYLPPEVLPKEYGGHLDSMIDLPKMLNDEEEYFREQLKYGFVKT